VSLCIVLVENGQPVVLPKSLHALLHQRFLREVPDLHQLLGDPLELAVGEGSQALLGRHAQFELEGHGTEGGAAATVPLAARTVGLLPSGPCLLRDQELCLAVGVPAVSPLAADVAHVTPATIHRPQSV
jgi:hypothetical protein